MTKETKAGILQYDRFIEAARKLGCDEDPAAFDEKLKVIVRRKPNKPKGEPDTKKRTKP